MPRYRTVLLVTITRSLHIFAILQEVSYRQKSVDGTEIPSTRLFSHVSVDSTASVRSSVYLGASSCCCPAQQDSPRVL